MDGFGIKAHTANLELPIKPTPFIAFAPFYRFHQQTSAKYFASIDEHILDEKYFTSDYDLSAFNSHKFGLAIRYSPINGILKTKNIGKNKRYILWKKIETRGAGYFRSDGLKAWVASIGASFSIN